MNDFSNFKMSDLIELGSILRRLGTNAKSMEEAARRIVNCLNDNLTTRSTETGKAFALVRFFKTHPFGTLDPELRESAKSILKDHSVSSEMKCLTLLASAGENPNWNSRKNSAGHKAIPLPNEEFVIQFPMISQLVNQFGLKVSDVLRPNPKMILELEQKTYNVFHVSDALGSPIIPAQKTFVEPYGIKSVLGFGSVLPSGDIFAVIMFSKIHISHEIADLFKSLALSVKMAVMPFSAGVIFENQTQSANASEQDFQQRITG
ncbi:MAG: hypothetical protein HQM10_12480 [Candidatus Riflebacteria bacterium]|nr:hypothetical protein [Candidatus Riflebacteria bacterium]